MIAGALPVDRSIQENMAAIGNCSSIRDGHLVPPMAVFPAEFQICNRLRLSPLGRVRRPTLLPYPRMSFLLLR
jgi:hypothetical protein